MEAAAAAAVAEGKCARIDGMREGGREGGEGFSWHDK